MCCHKYLVSGNKSKTGSRFYRCRRDLGKLWAEGIRGRLREKGPFRDRSQIPEKSVGERNILWPPAAQEVREDVC